MFMITKQPQSNLSRREALAQCIATASMLCFPKLVQGQPTIAPYANFKAIYQNDLLKARFKNFLVNVYHLYPEHEFHSLISKLSQTGSNDQVIYEGLLESLPEIQPFLGSFRYALPALKEQKRMIQEQTFTLLGEQRHFERYLSIGTTGRYYGGLSDTLSFQRAPIFVSYSAPTYGPSDVIERGQIGKFGTFHDLSNYQPLSKDIESGSVDLLTVYIGFHHASLECRHAFIASCSRVLKKGGILIVRDHDVFSPEYWHLVALAHDVFNAGLGVPWKENKEEVRNFTSINELIAILAQHGLKHTGPKLLQIGDPTINTLLRFDKA
jgi:hypothetical protein